MNYNVVLVYSKIEPLRYFSDQLEKAVEDRGIAYYIVDSEDESTYTSEEFYSFIRRSEVFALTFNGAMVDLRDGEGNNIWKKYDVRLLCFVNDHPRNYDLFLRDPQCDIHVVSLDRNHMDFIRRFYPDVKSVTFCPNGGTAESGNKPYNERSIDVIYLGSCQDKIEMFRMIPGLPKNGMELYQYGISYLIQNPGKTAESAVYAYLEDAGITLDTDNLYKLLVDINASAYIENYIRRYYKLSCMKALDDAGIHVEIYGGKSWLDDEIVFSENIMIRDRIPNKELNIILGNAKISLCFMPWYKRGCSEKTLDSMLNGAVCVSDRSEYLDINYRDGENIVFFDLNNPAQLAADIKWLLDNPHSAERIAQKGLETARKYDTWDERFELLLKKFPEILENYRSDGGAQ